MANRLSARQEECLRLTAFLTDKEIAARLGLSEPTVKKHVHEACRRLGVNRRKAALALLERNVPGTNGSLDAGGADALSPGHAMDGARTRGASEARSGGPDGGGSTLAGPSSAEADARRDRDQPPPGLAPPERRLGYRPPPRGLGYRLMIIAAVVVLGALVAKAVVDLVVGYTQQVQVIDRATTDGR